ncbi:hypothetical protein ACJ41O_009352 [Fusarium nematophilum]
MGLIACTSTRIIVSVLITIGLFAFFSPSTPSVIVPLPFDMAQPDTSPMPGLKVSLEQQAATTSSPPAVRVSVKNDNQMPVTVLTYGSPLDPLALQLGLLSITPAGEAQPLEIPQLEVQRQWPPEEDALVELQPGETREVSVEIKEPAVPMEKLQGSAKVVVRGKWQAVWAKKKSELGEKELEAGAAGKSAFSEEFESNSLDITVE